MSKRVFSQQASLIKALAHPGRLEIIHLLRAHALTVGQIAKMLGSRQAYVSQQLTVLKKSKIATCHRSGKEMYYEISDPRILTACDNIHSLVADKPLPTAAEPLVRDPICHMTLIPSVAPHICLYNGVRHYFCGRGCLKEFNISHKGVT